MDVKLIVVPWVLTITVLHQQVTVGLDLSSYETASFSINPSAEFTHFVTHKETGIVYLGASDGLYQLDVNLVRQEMNKTAVQCEGNVQICPNYNTILLIDYARDRLITCGNENQGKCQTQDLSNINFVSIESSYPVVSSGISSTEGIIAPGPDRTDVLYVSTGFDEVRQNHVFLLSRRLLNTTDDLLFVVDGYDQLVTNDAVTNEFTIHSAGAFQWNDFTYFVTSQAKDSIRGEGGIYVSKVKRVCHAIELYNSYAEILIECRSGGIRYNLIQAAHVGPAEADLAASLGLNATDDVFYGVFAKNKGEPLSSPIPSNQSAMCVFRLQDIEEAFIDAIHGCLTEGDAFQVKYIQDSTCEKFGVTRETAILQQCIDVPNWHIASGIKPLVSTAAIEWTDTIPSSIITTTHHNHTVAFVGTKDGSLVKIHIENATSARDYERFTLDGGPVLRDAELDSNKDMLTVLMQHKLFKLMVSNCSAYTTCDECIGTNGGQDGDPYCGWCTLERSCSRHDECPMADESTRWLPYNNAQCVSISNVAPYDRYPITSTEQEITLTVEQLPDLGNGASYQCKFDDIAAVTATKDGNMLTCTSPASSDIPSIPVGKDHVTMQLFVYSTESRVKFIQRNFYFYECDTHKGCIICTDSSWACDWCIYSNKCTHDSSTCSMEDDDVSSIINGKNNPDMSRRQGPEECPQLVVQEGEILIPVGVSRSITVTGMNLPDEDRVASYLCVLNIEDNDVSVAATRSVDTITCEPRMYTYSTQVQELDVRLAVIWNDNRNLDDEHGFKVTLYKCEVERPDCSRCLSNITTKLELMCGWCQTNDMCTVNERCNGDWMSSDTGGKCPAPVLSQIWPSSGPHEGNTVISVMGKDLGITFNDVEVTVGGKNCDTTGLHEEYLVGSSVSCRTPSGIVDSEVDIIVAIRGPDGSSHQSAGRVVFTYRNPSISSIMSQEGPEAGGAVVSIRGQYLDACSDISATIGSQCIINRQDNILNETTATCRSTSSPVGSSFPLVVSFDGAVRQSQDMFTYRPNPTVKDVQPKKTILSGGITLTVTGFGFNLAQTPQMAIYVDNEEFIENCKILNDTVMLCKTPNIKTSSDTPSRKRRQGGPLGEANFGFIIGDVSDLLTWSEDNRVAMEYFPDPVYFPFEENPRQNSGGGIEQIEGRNLDAGSSERDVTVYIGREKAVVETLGEAVLILTLPTKDPGRDCINGNTTSYTCVVVHHGYLPPVFIGTIQYPKASIGPTIGLAVGICVLVLLVLLIVIVIVVFRVHDKKLKRKLDALILERLILLQKSVEEQLDNLNADKNKPQESIFLPNNIQINAEDVKIRYNDLTMDKLLGHGAFGEVYLATLRTAGGMTCQVAVKTIQGEKDPSTVISFLEEGLIMKDFDHPNVLGLLGLTFDPEGSPLVVLPLMKNGDLKSFMKKTTEIGTEQKLKFSIDAARGMEYLAGKKFVHRDLAARNCMVDDDMVVKIGDFGRSRDMGDEDDYVSNDKKAKLPVKWMAPESLDRRLYNEKTDVWSFGVLMWEIFTDGAKPYRQIPNRNVYYYVTTGNRLPCPDNCRQDVYDIMKHCWIINPDERCTFSELLQKLSAILNLHAHLGKSSDQKLPESSDRTSSNIRDSYLQPIEQAVDNRDSYLHPTEEVNKGFVMEMEEL